MTPAEYAQKAIHENFGPLEDDASSAPGTIIELQATIMVLAGMVIALTDPSQNPIKGHQDE